MPEKNVVDVGTIRLGDEDYRLVRTEEHKQAWREEGIDEPPWHEGLPPLIGIEDTTWHLGGFKSREGIPGTTEYGTTDNRWPFQMLPGPHVVDLTMPDPDDDVTGFFEALGYIFVVGGERVFRIDPSDFSVVLSKDFATGVATSIMGLRWEGTKGLVGGRTYMWAVTTIGSPDTWAESAVYAFRLAAGIDRLFAVGYTGLLRNVSTGLDPATAANWADRVQCGPVYNAEGDQPTGLVVYENTVIVGRHTGVYGVSADEGIGVPLISRMVWDADNCLGMTVVEPYIFVPHSRGLYQLKPGVSVDSIGLEKEILNQTTLGRSHFRCFVVDNQWIYAGLEGPSGITSYIVVGRRRRQGEPGLGQIIWDTWIDLGAATQVRAAHISTLPTQPTLLFAKGKHVSYVKLPVSGAVPDATCTFAASSVRYSPKYNFGDWNPKDFPKVQIAARDASATRYWSLAYSVDGGAWVTDDIDSVAMDVKEDSVLTFFFAVAAVGREIQYRFTYTGPAADTTPVPLVYFKRFARPQSKKVPVIIAILHLAAGMSHDMAEEGRDAITQFSDLQTLSEQAASVVSRGPWGAGDVRVWVRHVRLLDTVQVGMGEPELLVEATLQKREAA